MFLFVFASVFFGSGLYIGINYGVKVEQKATAALTKVEGEAKDAINAIKTRVAKYL